jgi:hypothetical protein
MASALADSLAGTRRRGPVATKPSPPGASGLAAATTLGSYSDVEGERRLVALTRTDGSTLLLDTPAGSLADARVLALLSRDEPRSNALLIVQMYLSDSTRGRCRALQPQDLAPPEARAAGAVATNHRRPTGIDLPGARYQIRPVAAASGVAQLRWTCTRTSARASSTLTLRAVIGTLERYEPARAITADALANPVPTGAGVSHLALELTRLLRSPVVLNRGLREAVARAVAAGTTLSEIAMRCGRFKSDRHGQRSGETSWLARRIGQMPEAGQAMPTPWIHSDTLALIAREGLHLCPREVEL